MRASKVFGVKSITNLIYGLLMIAPFVAILSRVIYVQANPNAKDSYSNTYVNSQLQSNIVNLVEKTEYILSSDSTMSETATKRSNFYGFTQISLDLTNIPDYNLITYFGFLYYANGNVKLVGYENSSITNQKTISDYTTINDVPNITFTSNGLVYTEGGFINHFKLYANTYSSQTLDNAFEYSLQEFTKDNDIGVINFFGWFEGYFLDQTNAHNLVYLNFANWYMNFALLVSSSYLLFLALIWFVNYIRRILDKSMNQDYGGF